MSVNYAAEAELFVTNYESKAPATIRITPFPAPVKSASWLRMVPTSCWLDSDPRQAGKLFSQAELYHEQFAALKAIFAGKLARITLIQNRTITQSVLLYLIGTHRIERETRQVNLVFKLLRFFGDVHEEATYIVTITRRLPGRCNHRRHRFGASAAAIYHRQFR